MDASAHQRIIRDGLFETDPREVTRSLTGYSIEIISKLEAVPVIMKYEWLGNIGRAHIFVGLLSPDRELHGVACFGHGPTGDITGLIGGQAMCLERGACVHYAPSNAGSFLVNGACKLVYKATGVARFFAYGDPMAGEYGGIYQAAGWIYLGQGLDGKNGRKHRIFVLRPEADPNNPANWRTTRDLRRNGTNLSMKQALDNGWKKSTREAKHVYATCVGGERKKWLKQIKSKSYPAPRPELKRVGQWSVGRSLSESNTTDDGCARRDRNSVTLIRISPD